MKESSVDLYLRREDTLLARTLQKISPLQGAAYRNSREKEIVERAVAVPLFVATLPVLTGLAAIKYAEDRENPFYIGKRVGQEKMGRVIKIRSMVVDADTLRNQAAQVVTAQGDKADVRITPIGKVLRRFELDELPQVVQVATGELSLVGIRAASPFSIHQKQTCMSSKRYQTWLRYYKEGKPGFFNLSSAVLLEKDRKNDRRRTPIDIFYGKKASLGLDLYIIYRALTKLYKR